ncbi:MAG: acyltransferase family protein [Xenococcaceae cyanobacterium]
MSAGVEIAKTRLIWVDRLKGLTILSIVIFHFFQNYHDRLALADILSRNGARVGFAAVDLFFTIAGFNIGYGMAVSFAKNPNSSIDWLSWLKKRIVRLYPTYWLILSLTLILYWIFNNPVKLDWFKWIFIVLGLSNFQDYKEVNPGLWFFTVIVQAFLITPIIFIVSKNKPLNILFLGMILGAIAKSICWISVPKSEIYWLFLDKNLVVSYLFQLCLGIYWGFIYHEKQRFRKVDFYVSALVFSLGLFVYLYLGLSGQELIYKFGFDLLFNPLLFLLGYSLVNSKYLETYGQILKIDILTVLGNYSYQIFLTHQPLFFVFLALLVKNLAIAPYLKLAIVIIIMTNLLFVYVYFADRLDLLLRKRLLGQRASGNGHRKK